ncbi:MAG: hypothetical protein NT093_00020 [Candidatus Moranbacteria bacterium]|nr:hypothetical protein [Candidatus Moranbacteria bacterium]
MFSPIDIQIVSPSGKRLGKNFETGGTYDEIEGAYYTGFDTNTEFLTIPNPEDGEYQILTEGTGTGDYTIETTKISQDENTGEAVEATATITGTAEPDKQEENRIEIDGDSVKKVEPLTLPLEKKEEKETDAEDSQIQIKTSDSSAQSSENPTKIEQLDDLKNSVREYFKTKQIRKKSEKSYLLGWLGNIRVYLKRRNILEKQSKTSQKAYGKLQKKIVGHCNYLIRYLNKNSPKKIDESAKNDLVERLNILKL